ncbi:hypothetical protein PCL_01572 [Purpureocillium lilacinum]|uniref:Uncharacterized protein n=1 Tax=Purpureocillium lilacinum TaxID=33203 RepID=A0A2U3E3V4_PURLI|nr:hypothetical protein PCL_01572 [Purpureocillium lilacinum]
MLFDTTPTESTGSQQFTWSGGRSSTSAYTIDAASDNRHETLRLEPCPARPVANNATQLLLVRRGCPHPSGGYKSRTSRAVASASSGTARKLRDLSDTTRSTRWAGSPSGRTSSGTCAPTYVHDRTRRLGVRVFTGCVATNDGQQATPVARGAAAAAGTPEAWALHCVNGHTATDAPEIALPGLMHGAVGAGCAAVARRQSANFRDMAIRGWDHRKAQRG